MEAALEYARRGWPVLPIWEPRDGLCSCRFGAGCKRPGKHPRVGRGVKPTLDEGRIRRWWTDWPDANVAVATGPASGVVVVDVDRRNGGDVSFAALVRLFGDLSAPHRAATGNGFHLYFRDPGVQLAAGLRGFAGIDLKQTGYVVAPPSIHPNGTQYAWDPETHVEQLVDLPPWLVRMAAVEHRATSRHGDQLSQRMRRLLREGDTERRYRKPDGTVDQSRVVAAIALEAANKHWPEERLYRALVDPRNVGGRKVQERLAEGGERRARQYVHNAYERARRRSMERPAIQSREDALARLRRISELAERVRWAMSPTSSTSRGSRATSASAIYRAILSFARKCGGVEFRASERQLAEMMGIGRPAIHHALAELLDLGLIVRVFIGRGSTSSTWVLQTPPARLLVNSDPIPAPPPGGGLEDIGSKSSRETFEDVLARLMPLDAFRHRCLGKPSAVIVAQLTVVGTLTTSDLVRLLPRSRQALRRRLDKLATHDVVREIGPQRWTLGNPDYDSIAQTYATTGAGVRQRKQHQRERDDARRPKRTLKLVRRSKTELDPASARDDALEVKRSRPRRADAAERRGVRSRRRQSGAAR